jgi:hypothetical protein
MDTYIHQRAIGKQERIISAAILYPHLPTYRGVYLNQPQEGLVITGLRHCSCIYLYSRMEGADKTKADGIEGFVTTAMRFVGREEACQIAIAAGQVEPENVANGRLYSEDLY